MPATFIQITDLAGKMNVANPAQWVDACETGLGSRAASRLKGEILMKDIVQARMISEVLYCERALYLERVQGEFEHNYFTIDGNAVHKRADVPGGDLPPPTDLEDRPYKARSVWLTSETLGLTAKIDVVESDGEIVTPIEYKRGAEPEGGVHLSTRAQLCAQVLLLREHGYRVEEGAVYYAALRRRVSVAIDDELVKITLDAAERVRALSEQKEMPPPLVDSPKCNGCSLISICLPDETNALRTLAPISEPLRQLHPARDDKPPLYVQEQGARVGLSGECLVVRSRDEDKKEKTTEVPLALTSQVCLMGNVQVSTQAMRELMQRGIQVSFFTTGGWYCGRTIGVESKNAAVRIAQLRAADDQARCLAFARGIVEAKIKNCRTVLMRNAEELPKDVRDALAVAADSVGGPSFGSAAVDWLLGVEGMAAKRYFENFSSMLKGSPAFDFNGRNRRPPKDPINALLSLAYALLAKDFAVAITAVGLEPLLGLYHQPKHGRPALALDLMEEFRPVIADSVVVTAINTGVVGESDFVRMADSCALAPKARREFIQAYERRMDSEVTHPVFGYKISYRRVLEVQARLLTRWLLGEIPEYPQFLVR